MDAPAPAEDGAWQPPAPLDIPQPGAAAGPGHDAPSARAPLDDQDDPVERRLAAIEARLDSLEHTMRETVTAELHAAGDELRRAVSDLGRLLLRDLDRLTKVLADHRDAIVERVSALPPGPPPATGTTAPAQEAAQRTPGPLPAGDGTPPPEGSTSATAPAQARGEEGRWRAIPGRRKGRR